MLISPKFKLFKLTKHDKVLPPSPATDDLFVKVHSSTPLTTGTLPVNSPLAKQDAVFEQASTYSSVLLPSMFKTHHYHTPSLDSSTSGTTIQEETEHMIPPLPYRKEPASLTAPASAPATPYVGTMDDSERLANNILGYVSHNGEGVAEWAM